MRIGLREAWAGSRRTLGTCPHCGASRGRYSRRTYEGLGAAIFKVRPICCLECGTYFPIAVRSWVPSDTDLVDLNLPFRPTELDEPSPAPSGGARLPARPIPFFEPRGGNCPACGSTTIRLARFGSEVPWRRPDVREAWRCVDCNASFERVSLLRVAVAIVVSAVLLAVLVSLASATRFGQTGGGRAPTIRPNQVPQLPPPVFR